MASCHWAQPTQLHPWFKPTTLKRKDPPHTTPMPPPDKSSGFEARTKRQRQYLTLEQPRALKRRLSQADSPTDGGVGAKRQRCAALERGLAGLSIAPPPPLHAQRGPPAPSPPSNYALSSSTLPSSAPPPVSIADAREPDDDVRMRSSSWYEPEKDRIVVTDLDASSDDEDAQDGDDGESEGGAPRLPRALLQALLCGPPRDPRLAVVPFAPPRDDDDDDPRLEREAEGDAMEVEVEV
ncbi:hypothetical protein BC834DRAFT_969179 [Gloeopeniophorella convolvens]|nr:hypothetical protein BC834DRAFT_969179 [Gloeopeniophorella convolvens]